MKIKFSIKIWEENVMLLLHISSCYAFPLNECYAHVFQFFHSILIRYFFWRWLYQSLLNVLFYCVILALRRLFCIIELVHDYDDGSWWCWRMMMMMMVTMMIKRWWWWQWLLLMTIIVMIEGESPDQKTNF